MTETQTERMARPYKIFRQSIVGRALYDTQTTQEGADASVRTGKIEYPDQAFEIEAPIVSKNEPGAA